MDGIRAIALDLAPVAVVLVVLLALWLVPAALADRRVRTPRAQAPAWPAVPPAARVPGQRAGSRHRARESSRG